MPTNNPTAAHALTAQNLPEDIASSLSEVRKLEEQLAKLRNYERALTRKLEERREVLIGHLFRYSEIDSPAVIENIIGEEERTARVEHAVASALDRSVEKLPLIQALLFGRSTRS